MTLNNLPFRPSVPASRQKPLPQFGALDHYDATTIYGDTFRVTTQMFRHLGQFARLPDFLDAHFPAGATLYDYACSDGSEAFSIAMILERAGLSAEKYPIIGRDICPVPVAMANSGYLNEWATLHEIIQRCLPDLTAPENYLQKMSSQEQEHIQLPRTPKPRLFSIRRPSRSSKYLTDEVLKQAEHNLRNPRSVGAHETYVVSERLRSRARFEVGDLAKDSFPKNKPALILFNTVFEHLNAEQQREILKGVFDHAPSGTFLWIGDGWNVAPEALEGLGFEKQQVVYDTKGLYMLSLKRVI